MVFTTLSYCSLQPFFHCFCIFLSTFGMCCVWHVSSLDRYVVSLLGSSVRSRLLPWVVFDRKDYEPMNMDITVLNNLGFTFVLLIRAVNYFCMNGINSAYPTFMLTVISRRTVINRNKKNKSNKLLATEMHGIFSFFFGGKKTIRKEVIYSKRLQKYIFHFFYLYIMPTYY